MKCSIEARFASLSNPANGNTPLLHSSIAGFCSNCNLHHSQQDDFEICLISLAYGYSIEHLTGEDLVSMASLDDVIPQNSNVLNSVHEPRDLTDVILKSYYLRNKTSFNPHYNEK